MPQTVTVTGLDDVVLDGPRKFVIVTAPAISPDRVYNGFNAADVVGTNNDNDRAALWLAPIRFLCVKANRLSLGDSFGATQSQCDGAVVC